MSLPLTPLVMVLVALALLCPWAAVPAARRLAELLPPRAAALTLAGAAGALAGGTVLALGVLVGGGLLHHPALAADGRMSLPWVVSTSPAAVPVAAGAGLALLVVAGCAARLWHRQRALLARTWRSVEPHPVGGDLTVLPEGPADAFALPGHAGRAGRVVVTAAMLRALDRGERDVLLAHERAHLAGRHHLLARTAQLAAATHPALRGLRPALSFHLERWADEDAAATVGSRRLAATAVARAALAAAGPGRPPSLLLAVDTGPVPRRVDALLGPVPRAPRRRTGWLLAGGLLAVVVLSLTLSLGSAYGLHEYVEQAQEVSRIR
ncbi:M56 family metallopeptidase [Kitasatospora sp. NPDC088346]|uniref:M56 family metallopeptidase n=1 Tax=Kitasatospora sp. NPDC088346 TaxID=3364073 RepID=UPI0038273F6A